MSNASSNPLAITSTNPKDRIGLKKVPLGLISPIAQIHIAMAMKNGAVKYGPYNWRSEKVSANIYLDAMNRHRLAWGDGEELATDSGVHHLGHAAACACILLDAQATGQLVDDRFKSGLVSGLLSQFTEKTEIAPVTDPAPVYQCTKCGHFWGRSLVDMYCPRCGCWQPKYL